MLYLPPSGSVTITQSTQDEFYNGELSGSEHITTDGELILPTPIIISIRWLLNETILH